MALIRWSHRWNVLALTLLSQAVVVGIHTYAFSFWIVPWTEEFSVPRSQLMLIITLSIFSSGVMSPFVGIALDRINPRMLFCAGSLIFPLSLVLVSMATSHWIILLLYSSLMSMAVTICGQLGCQTLVAQCFKDDRGTALGLSALGVSAGGFLIPPIVTALLGSYNWRETFQILALAATFLLCPASWLILKKMPEVQDEQAGAMARSRSQTMWTTGKLLRSANFWIISGGFAAILIAYLPMLHSIGAFAKEIGISQPQAALGASLAAVLLSLGKLAFGKMSDTLPHRLLYRLAMAVMVAGIGMASFANSYFQFVFGLALASFAMGSYLPLLSSMVLSRFGMGSFGQVMGMATIVIQCGAIGPYLSGLLRDHTGSYSTALIVMLIPIPFAMLAMRWLTDKS